MRELRVAEYAANSLIQIKRELFNQGSKTDYNRAESYLKSRWSFWAIRIKMALDFVSYNLKISLVCEYSSNFSLQNEEGRKIFESTRYKLENNTVPMLFNMKLYHQNIISDPLFYPQVSFILLTSF